MRVKSPKKFSCDVHIASFAGDFMRCMLIESSPDELDATWAKMLEIYYLKDNLWWLRCTEKEIIERDHIYRVISSLECKVHDCVRNLMRIWVNY